MEEVSHGNRRASRSLRLRQSDDQADTGTIAALGRWEYSELDLVVFDAAEESSWSRSSSTSNDENGDHLHAKSFVCEDVYIKHHEVMQDEIQVAHVEAILLNDLGVGAVLWREISGNLLPSSSMPSVSTIPGFDLAALTFPMSYKISASIHLLNLSTYNIERTF